MIVGLAVYFTVFNLIYLLLLGKSYSFSTVEGPIQLINQSAISSVIAFVLGLIIVLWKYRVFHAPNGTGKIQPEMVLMDNVQVLRFTWLSVYALLIPVACCFVLNCLQATWTLPDVTTSFLGVIFGLQILLVVLAGLLLFALTGIFIGWKQRVRQQ
jgi:hypothetical protein